MRLSLKSLLACTAIGATLSLGGAEALAQGPGFAAPAARALAPANGLNEMPFGMGRLNCGHVIELLMRNRMFKHAGIGGPIDDFGLVGPGLGDLELVSVGMIADATGQIGPNYAVTIRNDSEQLVRRFSITAVAVLGEIDITSPVTIIKVDQIGPGEVVTVPVQLPMTAMAMSPDGQNLAPFDRLVVAIDSFDELLESDELNNVLVLKRAEVVLVQPAAAEAPAEELPPGTAAPNALAPEEAAPANPSIAPTPMPNENAGPNPNNRIDFDSLDLGEADNAANGAPQ